MKYLSILLLVFSLGCAEAQVSFIDEAKNPVTVKAEWAGRGCLSVDMEKPGVLKFLFDVAATSDWAGIRIIPSTVQAAIAAFFSKTVPNPVGIPSPSTTGGCDKLFVTVGDDDPND